MLINRLLFEISCHAFLVVILLASSQAAELVLADRGVAHATIVVPVKCPEKVMVAAKDIQETIKQSTDVSLSIVEEDQEISGTRLLVGPGSWAESLEVTIPAGSGFRDERILIKRIGSDVVIVGNDDGALVGTQDAAIRFLNVVVGADYYYASPLGQMDQRPQSGSTMRKHPLQTSGLIIEADWHEWTVDDLKPYVQVALDLFGPERCMFGSDWPVCLLAGSYEEVVDSLKEALGPLGTTEHQKIFGETAAKFYRL